MVNQGCFRTSLSVGRFIGEVFNIEKIKFLTSIGRKHRDNQLLVKMAIVLVKVQHVIHTKNMNVFFGRKPTARWSLSVLNYVGYSQGIHLQYLWQKI